VEFIYRQVAISPSMHKRSFKHGINRKERIQDFFKWSYTHGLESLKDHGLLCVFHIPSYPQFVKSFQANFMLKRIILEMGKRDGISNYFPLNYRG